LLTYSESLLQLLQLERFGMKFGLEGISRLLKHFSDPHRKFLSVHVAGTNGKGSVASMLASMSTSTGLKTGLYTSPHLIRFEERIRINGRPIPRTAVAALTSSLVRHFRKGQPTFFEATTALAFKYFADEKVDIVIVETGLGGRLDSTNVIRPLASVITNVEKEHTEILGESYREIAREKSGIIKRGKPCITGARNKEALRVIRRTCGERSSPLTIATDHVITVHSATMEGSLIDFRSRMCAYKDLKLSLAGSFQYDNLAVALATVAVLNGRGELKVDEGAIRDGLGNVQKFAGLTGRLSIVHEKPRIIADVAHNPDAVRNLCEGVKRLRIKNPVVVFGVLRDKDYIEMVRTLAGIAKNVVAVAPRSDRARSASDVAAAFEKEGSSVCAALSVEEGIKLASDLAGKGGTVLLTGSHFVVGEGMAALQRKRA
jgi:dihydrofolate synthase/folylpolyglutamate synthase